MSTVISTPLNASKPWLAGLFTCTLFLIVCLSWGTTWLGIKIAVESVPPLTAAGLRFLIAFPLFLSFAVLRKEPLLFPRQSRWFFLFVTLSYFSLPYYLLNYGELHVSSGLTALLFSCMPVFILVFSSLFLREKILPTQMLGIAIGFASLYMIIRSQGLHLDQAEWLGVLAILCAAILHALCYVVTKQHGSAISVITYNTLPIGIAGLMLLIVGLNLETPVFKDISARSWGALLYLGLVASVGGFIVYFILLKRLSPVLLSFVFIIFPVFALLIGAWYEGTPISRDLMLYSAILLAGFAITKLPLKR
ncbi:DMT family transporter [Pseudomonas sp. HMWF006]|uniref:DMT family transporter n=1 Tax=Pseudomonas sp. HMWF006 TaxID=2056843 RepID=UPI000D4211D2|nr:EamA family transporter [Pseudomonas sp. HMWF006]PTS94391.1 EamA family transporter [Pseudomonas sp. HMWF006]PTT60644.1 EamA family transporter [Pseudomonas sp. HMWF007]PTT89297.1 EamA family transporter [Pseudomonas sp. HMWF005]